MPQLTGARARSALVAPRPVLPNPVMLEGFESATGISGTGATVALSASPRAQGANALKMTPSGFGGSSILTAATRAFNCDAANLRTIAFWQNFENTYCVAGGIQPTITVGGTAYSAPQYAYYGGSPYGGRWAVFHASDFLNGTTALSTIGAIGNADVKLNDAIATPFFGPIETDCLMYNAGGRPTLVMTWDDGHVSQYTRLFPLLKKYGLVGAFSPIMNQTQANQASSLTAAMLKEMDAAGQLIMLDGTVDDTDVTAQASLSAAMNGLASIRSWMTGLGLTRGLDHGNWPFGIFERSSRYQPSTLSLTSGSNVVVVDTTTAGSIQTGMSVFAHSSTGIGGLTVQGVSGTNITLSGNAAVTSTNYRCRFVFTDDTNAPFYGSKLIDAMRAVGFKTFRAVSAATFASDQLYSRYGLAGQEMCYPSRSIGYADTAAGVLADVDRAILLGTTLALFSHDIEDSTSSSTPNSVATATWDAILSGVAQRVRAGLIDVLTPAQWYARDLATPLAPPF